MSWEAGGAGGQRRGSLFLAMFSTWATVACMPCTTHDIADALAGGPRGSPFAGEAIRKGAEPCFPPRASLSTPPVFVDPVVSKRNAGRPAQRESEQDARCRSCSALFFFFLGLVQHTLPLGYEGKKKSQMMKFGVPTVRHRAAFVPPPRIGFPFSSRAWGGSPETRGSDVDSDQASRRNRSIIFRRRENAVLAPP